MFTHVIINGNSNIRFTAKPTLEVRTLLKSAGYRWAPSQGQWYRRGTYGTEALIAALTALSTTSPQVYGREDYACSDLAYEDECNRRTNY